MGKVGNNFISDRLMSLDALRGFDMFLIIGGGQIYNCFARATGSEFLQNLLPMTHKWSAFGTWDLIMPLFFFVIGAVMPFSFGKRLAKGHSSRQLHRHIIRRTLILYMLGMVANGHLLEFDLSTLKFTGTLQGIALGYIVASLLVLNFNIRPQVIATAALLLLYWALLALVPVPGFGAGVYAPEGNLAGYVEGLVMGRFRDGHWTYVLTSMTFGCSIMLGTMAGHLLRLEKSEKMKVFYLMTMGLGYLLLGYVWDFWFPINNHIWTSSMVVFAGGWSCLLLALFYLIIDVWEFRKWAFGFVVIGMNAITVYTALRFFDGVPASMADKFVGGLSNWLGQWNDFVQQSVAFTIVWLILYWMYRKKTFIKI